jgi:hypothetical protein
VFDPQAPLPGPAPMCPVISACITGR